MVHTLIHCLYAAGEAAGSAKEAATLVQASHTHTVLFLGLRWFGNYARRALAAQAPHHPNAPSAGHCRLHLLETDRCAEPSQRECHRATSLGSRQHPVAVLGVHAVEMHKESQMAQLFLEAPVHMVSCTLGVALKRCTSGSLSNISCNLQGNKRRRSIAQRHGYSMWCGGWAWAYCPPSVWALACTRASSSCSLTC